MSNNETSIIRRMVKIRIY